MSLCLARSIREAVIRLRLGGQLGASVEVPRTCIRLRWRPRGKHVDVDIPVS